MGGLFGGKQQQQEPKPAAPMPDETSEGVREAARRKRMDIMARSGRSSTILTSPEDRGGDYTGTKLGAS